MPKETEKTIRGHIRQLNGIFPQFKIKTNDFLSLIRELYVHPDYVKKSGFRLCLFISPFSLYLSTHLIKLRAEHLNILQTSSWVVSSFR